MMHAYIYEGGESQADPGHAGEIRPESCFFAAALLHMYFSELSLSDCKTWGRSALNESYMT